VMNNTHCKFALRDDRRFVVLTSNVTAHFAAPCGWRGVGVDIQGDSTSCATVWDAFAWLWRGATPQRCTGSIALRAEARHVAPTALGGWAAIRDVRVLFERTCAGCVADRLAGATTARALLEMIASARTTVDVVASNLSSRRVIRALLEASRRGVRVRCVLSHGMNTFYRWLGHLTNEQVERRYSHELEIRWANRRDATCRLPGCQGGTAPRGVNHSKLLVVDDEHVLLGSSNLDWLSIVHSSELNVAFVDPGRHIANVFARFWAEALGSA